MAPNLTFNSKSGCELVDCRPPAPAVAAEVIPQLPQNIDYLAKDYDSFLRGMLDMLPTRIPGWTTRTEADLGMALLELFAYIGDQLSYYQDRVAAEGFLRTASQYESVRRLLSLIDYSLSPGTAAKALVAITTTAARAVNKGFAVTTKGTDKQPSIIFEAIEDRVVYPNLNVVLLHSSVTAGSSLAVFEGELDLFLTSGVWVWFQSGSDGEWAQIADPISVDHLLHTTTVNFSAPLMNDYDKATTQINGNGLMTSHGESHTQIDTGSGDPGQRVALNFAPLTYVEDGAGVAQTTLRVTVAGKQWQQAEDFINSDPTDFHYTIARDNQGYITVQFGNGAQGRKPDAGAAIEIDYRSGTGMQGMIAPGSLTQFQDLDQLMTAVVNPQASFGGTDPADIAEAKLIGPRTLHTQNRAVTSQDYADALLQGVAWNKTMVTPLHAKAQFVWTGSWNTVVVSVDFQDRQSLASVPFRRQALEAALNRKRLAGYDVQVEDARYAPMNIELIVHVKPEYFIRQVRTQVELAIGPLGFFAPARFDFGQSVRLSDLYAVVLKVEGVRYITPKRFKRLGDRYPDHARDGVIEVGPLEIARCDNDPAHPGDGIILLQMCGGKEG
ncbi:MAG TPA: putative baseplate assembly protein [Candidatus Angelobacter sp.]|nr:putative baseplate assembly protein [Candidatus Angelobacter sp.]